jgi:hypothetical protein
MRKLGFILVACVMGLLAACSDDDAVAPNLYLIPDGYKGWVQVVYDKDEGQPTGTEGEYTVIKINKDGKSKVKTTFTHEGWATNKYYYVTKNGERKELKPGEMIHGATEGRESIVNAGEENFFVGTQEEFAQATDYTQNAK